MVKKKKSVLIFLFLILILGFSLRIYNLGKFSLWYDEALTLLQAENIKELKFGNLIPPVYIYFIHFWAKIADTEFGLRFPSVIFSISSIWMLFVLGETLYTQRVGLISAFLLSISPFHIYYAQEVRMYSLMTLVALVTIYFLIKCLKDGRIQFWVGLICFNLLNVYCHYVGLFFWLAQATFFFLVGKSYDKKIKKRWIISNFLIFLGFFPSLAISFNFISEIAKGIDNYMYFWSPAPSLKSLFMTCKIFSIGYNAVRVVYLAMMGFSLFFFIKAILRFRRRKELTVSLVCLFVPVFTVFMISKFMLFYIDRYFISSSLFYFLLIALGLAVLTNKKLLFCLLFISFLSAIALKNYYNNVLPYPVEEHMWVQQKKEHRAIAEYISRGFKEDDALYHTCRNTIFPFVFYSNRFGDGFSRIKDRNICLELSQCSNSLKFLQIDMYDRCLNQTASQAVSFRERKRFWLIFSFWDFEREKSNSSETFALFKWLDKNYVIVERKEFVGAIIFLYQKKITKGRIVAPTFLGGNETLL